MPIRACKFIARKNWIICGADDLSIRVVNYNTQEKVARFDGHSDYIRSLAVHPTKPFVLSSSDDMSIKLWDWEKGWKNVMTFEGHFHYVMCVAFNPKDSNTFASASLDRTIKIWNIGSSTPNYTLEGHEKGVNCVDYYLGGEKPYLISGADDRTVKIWDYQNKSCIQTLEGHTQNVSSACFHPELPIILTGSEDGTVKMWHSNTFKLEATLSYGYERIWTLSYKKGSNEIGLGCDDGTIVVQIGREEPAASMDNSGKIIWAKHSEIQTVSIKSAAEMQMVDGEKLSLPIKDLGTCEMYPQTLQHSPSGRFVVVCGDGEYIIYTALAWRNKDFGKALDFVWGDDANDYAIRESPSSIFIYKNFKKEFTVKPPSSCDAIYGGSLLGLRCFNFLCFYDWNTQMLVRRIDISPTAVKAFLILQIYWSANGKSVAIVCKDSYYILKYDPSALSSYLEQGMEISADGIEESLSLVEEVQEFVQSGTWIGDCFIYTSNNKLCYFIGNSSYIVSHFSSPCFILGYVPRDNRVYLIDKEYNIVSYELNLIVIEYQTCILMQEFEKAQELLPNISSDQRNKIAKFLETLNFKEMALEITGDPDHRFDLAISLKKLSIAQEIATQYNSEVKWKTLGDLALAEWNFALAETCYWNSKDYSTLLIFYSSAGNAQGLQQVAQAAEEKMDFAIAFNAFYLSGNVAKCIELLSLSDSPIEAALMAKSFMPSVLPDKMSAWKSKLNAMKHKAADVLASPFENAELFPGFEQSLSQESKSVPKQISPKTFSPLQGTVSPPQDTFALPQGRFSPPKGTVSPPQGAVSPQDTVSPPHDTFPSEFRPNLMDENINLDDGQSMEVNTTGTGSVKADDLDDLFDMAESQIPPPTINEDDLDDLLK